jgi:protein TonB
MKAAPLLADSAADPIGWRVANALAIAAPYLLAAALFVVLYLQPTSPPAQAALSAPPPARESATAAEPLPAAAAPSPAPSTMHPAAPATLKNAAATASGPAASPATASAAAVPVAAVVPPANDPPLPTQPVPVDAAIARTMKLSGDPPEPSAAGRSAHLHGVVVVGAIVGPDGIVQSVQPVSGPALLELATLTAVRSWRYRPYLIYGKAVAFQTQVVIDFELDSPPQ